MKGLPVEKVVMPVGAKILTAMDVNGEPTVFAVINQEEQKTVERTIYRITSGKPCDPDILKLPYIGSFSVANYGIVYHFFSRGVQPLLHEVVDDITGDAQPAGEDERS